MENKLMKQPPHRNSSGDDHFIIQLSNEQSHEHSSFNKADEVHNTDLKSYKKSVLTVTEGYLPTHTNPSSSPDNKRGIKAFLRFAGSTLINIHQEEHGILLFLCASYLVYQVSNNNSSNPFELQSPNYSLLTLEEAFPMFLPEMAHISKFILCYSLTWFLVWPLQPGLRIFLMFLLVSTPFYYFPELARQGRGIRVDCGLFKLRLIWFATLGALCLCLTCSFVTLVIVYFSWKHMNYNDNNNNGRGIRRMRELRISLGDIASAWGAG